MKVKKNSKLFKELQDNDIFDEFWNYKMPNYFECDEINSAIPDYFCPPNHKMVESTSVPKFKFHEYKIAEALYMIKNWKKYKKVLKDMLKEERKYGRKECKN